MPVLDLHRHFEGSHPLSALVAVARRFGPAELADPAAMRAACVLGPSRLREARDDAERRRLFAGSNGGVRRVYTSPAALELLAFETCVAAAAEAPDGFELRLSLFSLVRAQLAATANPARTLESLGTSEVVELAASLLEAVVAGARRSGAPAKLRFGLSRNLDPAVMPKYEAVARLAVAWRGALCGLDVLGIAATGFPEAYPPALVALVRELRASLPDLVVHAGEFCDRDPAEAQASLRAALALEPDGIGHGVWAASDPELMRECVGHGVVLEVCPMSNLLLNVDGMRRLEEACGGVHPLVRLLDAGVPCLVSSDNPTPLGATLEDNRRFVAAAGVGLEELDASAARRWAQLPPPRAH